MKKPYRLLILLLLLFISSQDFSLSLKDSQPFTYQVVPAYFNYGGSLVGLQVGINYKEVFNIGYFHIRDYDFGKGLGTTVLLEFKAV